MTQRMLMQQYQHFCDVISILNVVKKSCPFFVGLFVFLVLDIGQSPNAPSKRLEGPMYVLYSVYFSVHLGYSLGYYPSFLMIRFVDLYSYGMGGNLRCKTDLISI